MLSLIKIIAIIVVLFIVVLLVVRPHINRKRERLIFEMVNDVSSLLGSKVYADFGTLLGAYRDGYVIKDDLDGDLAILRKDEEECFQLISQLDPRKYSLTRDPLKLKVWIRGTSIGCDIAIYDMIGLTLVRQMFIIPYSRVFPLQTIQWRGKSLNAPKDIEWYLEYEYGKDWRTPRPGDKGREAADQGKWEYSWIYAKGYQLLSTLTGIPLLFR